MAVGTKVKGITIEFNGDTTKLGKALSDVDKKTKAVDKSLKEVNNALKFNPKNTELLAQKQQLLGQKIDQTKDRLKLLQETQKKMDDDPSVDKTSQDYMELRREIIETESKLKHFEDEAKKLDNIKLKQMGQSFQNAGDKMKAAGAGMTKYVTGPIVGVGAASVVAFNEVKDGLNIVTQKTGATGESLEGMHQIVKDMAQEIPADFETIGSAVGEVNTRFGLQGQELQDLSTEYVKFAKVNQVDVSDAIDTTQKALSAFGLGAEDATSLLDILTRVSQNTGASVDSLANGLIQNGTAFQELGLNVQQSATLMGQLEKSGANSETVMQGLRKALKNAAEDGVPLDEALSNLQNTIMNGTGSMDGLTAAYDLFGKSGDQIYGAVKNGTIDFNDLAGAAEDMGGVLDRTFEQTLTPSEKFQTTLNTLKTTGYEIANTVLPMITPLLEKIAEKVKALADKWNQLSPGVQKAILIAGGIAAAIGPVLVILGTLAGAIGSIITLVTTIGPALAGLAGPIGIAIAIIGGLIAVGVILYKNWDKIKAKASELKDNVVKKFTALKIAVKVIFGHIKDAMLAPIKKAAETIKGLIQKIKNFFKFKVSLPKIKLPHFSIQPKGWQLGDLLKGSIPSLGIDWHADGIIFKKPTVIGKHGFGEAGPEAAMPLDTLWDQMDGMFARMADSIVNGVSLAVAAQNAGMRGDIVLPIYLYPSGPKMGEETVKMYDLYSGRLKGKTR